MLDGVGFNSSTAPWYLSRATGVVTLLLLTMVMVLGILVTRQGRLPGLPGFVVTGLHRNLSLLAVAFAAGHVLTAVGDSYVHIPLSAAFLPLASPYDRLSITLGAAGVDLMLAAIVTSLIRGRLSRKAWRFIHLFAYLSWPAAWLHSVSASPDLTHGVLFIVAIACGLAVGGAFTWRVIAAAREIPRAERVGLLMAAVHDRASLRERLSGHQRVTHRQGTGAR